MTGAQAGTYERRLSIYVARHCGVCLYATEVAESIRLRFPHVHVDVVDIDERPELAPDEVFATPTYILEGKVWSLGNPSEEQIQAAFG